MVQCGAQHDYLNGRLAEVMAGVEYPIGGMGGICEQIWLAAVELTRLG